MSASRRKLITTGLAATAGVSGLAAAARLAGKYGLVPPDHGGLYGPGHTLTYASHRLLTGDALAREFPRHQISRQPYPNGKPPQTEDFVQAQAEGFANWRLRVEPRWWNSVDLPEALHPQTLLTYGMNGADLPVGHGGPLRVRVPRQLGYKSVKYVTRLTVTDDLRPFMRKSSYSWYAGI
jgi:hypothetical protein